MTRTQLDTIAKKIRLYAQFLNAPFWQQGSLALSQDNPFEWEFPLEASANSILMDVQDIIDKVMGRDGFD